MTITAVEDGIPWLDGFVGFLILMEVVNQYLNFRQRKCYKIRQVPRLLNDIVTQEEFDKAQAYGLDSIDFSTFHGILDLILSLASLVGGLYPYLWRVAGDLIGTNEYYRSLVFLGLMTSVSTITELPMDLYHDFVIEERHGFNKKTLKLFFEDLAKSLALQILFGTPVVMIIIWLVRWGGPMFYVYVWVFSVAFTIFMMVIHPNFIAPLFNKFENLQDDDLRQKINDLAARLKFPLTKLYQMDGSRRSAHSNAYFYGFWKNKRIVIFDTLLTMSHDEILGVLGHELGHWSMNHVLKGMVLAMSQMFGLLYLFSWSQRDASLLKSFGFAGVDSVIVGFMVFFFIVAPINTAIGVVVTLRTRIHEFQADEFAVKLGYGADLASGLRKLQKQNLGTMIPDAWYAWYHYSHPPLLERLTAIEEASKKME